VHPPSPDSELHTTIRQLGDVAGAMLSAAADAWEHHDALAAEDLERRDDEADLLLKMVL
jgi:phosphate uptake regulator